MSASIRPTRWPSLESATARLTATVVLPTPPLPEPTATILETPGSATGAGMACECAISDESSLHSRFYRRASALLRHGHGGLGLFAAGFLCLAVLAPALRVFVAANLIW